MTAGNNPKHIVLTGVSRGLGLAMAAGFIEAGHTVYGCARSEKSLEELRSRWPGAHRFHAVDVADDAAVAAWARIVLAEADSVDLVVNNAALMNTPAPLWEVPAAEIQSLVDVNIVGVTNVIRHFAPSMVARKSGVIVNFSSGWGRSTSAEVAPYCATKWAIEGLKDCRRRSPRNCPRGWQRWPLIRASSTRTCFARHGATGLVRTGRPRNGPCEWYPFCSKLDRPKTVVR